MTTLSLEAVADVAYQAGFRGEGLVMAIAISSAENSSHDPTLRSKPNNDPWRSTDRGLWQINDHWHPEVPDSVAFDALGCARAAYAISGGGSNWKPWSTFGNGAYKSHLTEARVAANTVTARGGTSASTTATASGDLSPDIVPTAAGTELPLKVLAPTNPDDFKINGITGWGSAITAGSWDLTAAEISELKLTLADPDLQAMRWLLVDVTVDWAELEMIIAGIELKDGPGGAQLEISARPAGAQFMKLEKGDETWANMSRTEVLALLARRWHLDFVGQGSHRTATLARQTSTGGTAGAGSKSTWDMGKEFATDLGFWFFEAAGTLYFGRPSWLVDHLIEFKVGYRGAWGDEALDCVGVPNAKRGFDATVTVAGDAPNPTTAADPEAPASTPKGKSAMSRSVTVRLPRWRGEAVRPGMKLRLKGVPQFDIDYITTKVSWPLDAGVDFVTVEAVEPIDPMPQDATAAQEASAATTAAPTADAKTGWEGIDQAVTALGLKMGAPTPGQTTGGTHVANSEHYQGRARDYGNASSDDAGIARALLKYATGAGAPIDELFHTPTGTFMKNGARISPSSSLSSGHRDHCHVGVRAGIALANYVAPSTLPDPAGVAARDRRVA